MAIQNSAGKEADWVAFTIRLPRAMHDYLRSEAFWNRSTMSEIVREEVAARMVRSNPTAFAATGTGYDATAVPVGEITGPIGIVKP